ncbi:MAG: hypothetical protein AAGD10_10415 [Myxococcota bacterium]
MRGWSKRDERLVVRKAHGASLREGGRVYVFRILDDKALVSWGTGPDRRWAWVPSDHLVTEDELRSIRSTAAQLARIRRSLERDVPLFSTEADAALATLDGLEPVVPEQRTPIEELRFRLLRARDEAREAAAKRETERIADEEHRAAQRRRTLARRLRPDIQEAQALLQGRREVFGIWMAQGRGRADLMTGRDRRTGEQTVVGGVRGVGVRVRRTRGEEAVIETGQVTLSLTPDGVAAKFVPRRVMGRRWTVLLHLSAASMQ